MVNLSERVADSYRKGSKVSVDHSNPVTHRRRKLYQTIKERTGGDPSRELEYSLSIIAKERPKLEAYVLSKNEVPMDNLEDLVMQVYQLRSNEIDDAANTLDLDDAEAGIFLESDEAETELANNPEAENFVGELFAPVGIAAKHLSEPDSLDPNIITGITSAIGSKFNKAALKRAAQNKPAGVAGVLTSGKKSYEILRKYLQEPDNKDEKDLVLKGVITDVTQLRGYGAGSINDVQTTGGVKVAANDVLHQIRKNETNKAIKENLPIVIIGLVVIIVITVLIVKNAKRS